MLQPFKTHVLFDTYSARGTLIKIIMIALINTYHLKQTVPSGSQPNYKINLVIATIRTIKTRRLIASKSIEA